MKLLSTILWRGSDGGNYGGGYGYGGYPGPGYYEPGPVYGCPYGGY